MPFLSNLMFLFSAQWKMATRAMIANKKILSQWSPVLCLFTSEHPNFISSLWNLNRCLLFNEYVANCVLSPIMFFTTGIKVYCYAVYKRVVYLLELEVECLCWVWVRGHSPHISQLWPKFAPKMSIVYVNNNEKCDQPPPTCKATVARTQTQPRNSTSNWSVQDPRIVYFHSNTYAI